MAAKPSDIATKLAAARTRLILEKPFLGSLVMHLPLVAADAGWCETTATDARAFYYNPAYVAALTLGQTQFMLAHEALHCALGHFARRQHRVKRRWDVACDHAANQLLVQEGLKPPPGALLNELYQNLTAEEIYPLIEYGSAEKTLDRHIFEGEGGGEHRHVPDAQGSPLQEDEQAQPQREGGGSGGEQDGDREGGEASSRGAGAEQPEEAGAAEREELARQWRSRLASAAQQAKRAGRLNESLARILDELLQPQLPWRMLLARYLKTAARDDYSFQRPSRREGAALLPTLASEQVDVVVALDTSGSVGAEELREFVSEVDALKGQLRARVILLACDENLSPEGPWAYQPWEPLQLPESVGGGGGTRFTPVFEWVEKEGLRPDLLLYFTDAEGEFPLVEPPYPVIWLVKGRSPVPWGQRIQLN